MISSLALIWGVVLLASGTPNKSYNRVYESCIENNEWFEEQSGFVDYWHSVEYCEQSAMRLFNSQENAIQNTFIIGIMLPIMFFTVRFLYNFLRPVVDNKQGS